MGPMVDQRARSARPSMSWMNDTHSVWKFGVLVLMCEYFIIPLIFSFDIAPDQLAIRERMVRRRGHRCRGYMKLIRLCGPQQSSFVLLVRLCDAQQISIVFQHSLLFIIF